MKKSVSSIIVTFNRKKDLLRCVNAVLSQAVLSENLIIVNNASTDGTFDFLKENLNLNLKKSNSIEADEQNNDFEIFEAQISETRIFILNKSKNTGGAGGFYTGLRFAHKNLSTDLYWMMDDDGYPEKECLQKLVSKSDENDYIMPVSIDINNHEKLSWFIHKRDRTKTDNYEELKADWGKILNWVVPFNGVLLSKNCVEKAGYINKDFFIWGDDYEHYYRCKKNGITGVTLLDALFYHPSQTVSTQKMFFGLLTISYSQSELRMCCMIRNWTYIYRHYNQKYKIPIKFLMYSWFFLFTRHFDFKGLKLYIDSVSDGFKGDFSRHFKYL